LDGLRIRLQSILKWARVSPKWRAVIALGDGIPSRGCIEANAQALARYAALCQEGGLVPVVEPEVLMAGNHTLERSREVTEEVLLRVFAALHTQRVMLEGMILKPNMVLPGLTCTTQETADEVADATVKCLLRVVAAAVPGIAFLSGGQSGQLASARFERHECQVQGATGAPALGAGFFIRSRDPAPGPGDLGGRGGPPIGGAASSVSSGPSATGLRAAANTVPRWKRLTRNQACCKCGIRRIAKADSLIKPGADQPTPLEHKQVIATQNRLLQLYFIRHGETAWSLTGQHTESRTFR